MSRFGTTLWGLRDELAAHLVLSFAALALGIAIALPLIVAAARNPHAARVALGLASLVQTMPALALLALFYPLLLSLSVLVGGGIPALGFLPALLALALYAVLPILHNGVAALRGLDPAVREAADAMGLTPGQKLRWIEAPLVAPLVLAGIRTAAVWTVGAGPLATTVGATSLGNPIFAGLQTQDWVLVLAGCAAAAGLALATDGVLVLVERGVAQRRPALAWLGLALVALALGWALVPARAEQRPTLVVGAKNFSEQYILARLIGTRLDEAGFAVSYREGLGSAVVFKALESGDIDVYVDYAGTLWTSELRRTDSPAPEAMRAGLAAYLTKPGGARLLGTLGFENAYAFAMKPDVAKARGIASLQDLVRAAPDLTLGTDLEFLDRPEWRAVESAYLLRFRQSKRYSPTFMYRALASDDADVITAFSSDGRIAADGLTVLSDPSRAIPNYDALLLVSGKCAADPRCFAALRPLIGRIPVAAMREANYRVDRDDAKQTPESAASWLATTLGLAR
ncbi:ABC transporter permease/substrate-binding protein [Novosphingobium sp. Gsoil 351]|uniref:ABC transporter permease/substrate-binding protein n=1 Tax=Novosphingobium sp. Gsoil 351 TaxID=2675225 RepID=UPI0012B46F32|nr:glycine betaine ABC transporter substrate-binding protein [Novosphingobium sp. Gsoil 351]QGN53706.1 ABC transporter permease subunit [Novosphingobium sp. Gsoil 351]